MQGRSGSRFWRRLALLMLCCIVVFFLLPTKTEPFIQERLVDFFNQNEAKLEQVMQGVQDGYISFYFEDPDELSEAMRWAYDQGIGMVDGKRVDDDAHALEFEFWIEWVDRPSEGHAILIYHPRNISPADTWMKNGNFVLVAQTETSWYFIGAHRYPGYVRIDRIQENLFYEEAYLPT